MFASNSVDPSFELDRLQVQQSIQRAVEQKVISAPDGGNGATRTKLRRSHMAPTLAYGRHRGPISAKVRHAAVLAALYLHPDLGWVVPLTLRPKHLEHHPGQICFPGGGVERGEDHVTAAIREFTEELGVPIQQTPILGELSTTYVYASRHQVRPFVCVMKCPEADWVPDPKEVEEVIEFPLRVLRSPESKSEIRNSTVVQKVPVKETGFGGDPYCTLLGNGIKEMHEKQLTFHAPCYFYSVHCIWGATAMILDELSVVLPPRFFGSTR